jgi:rubrerythrin
MKEWHSTDEILDFAIGEEQAAADFYTDLADRMTQPWMRKTFEDFAKEEMGHKAKLISIKEGGAFRPVGGQVPDLKIGDYLTDVGPSPGMAYQDALIVAMKKEKAAFRLYSDLAASTEDENLQAIFLMLAQEEAKHKLRFELEYDDYILTEN